MHTVAEKITEQALALADEDRAMLADRLVVSLDPADNGPMHRLWVAEAIKRRDDVRSGRVQTIAGDLALTEVRQAFGG